MSSATWRSLAVFISLFLMLFSIGCTDHSAVDHSRTVIRVGLLQHGSSIPFIVAQQGLFQKHGVEVEFVNVTPEQQMPSLLRGDVDVITPSSFPVIFSTYQQNPQKIQCFLVGGESQTGDILYGIVVGRESSFKTLGDLIGKRIGSASRFTSVNLRNVLLYKFHDKSQTTVIQDVGNKALLLEGLQKGNLDAAVVDQPALSSKLIQDQFRVIEKNFRAKYLFQPYWSGAAVARSDWVLANKEKYNAFLDAIDDALVVTRRNPTDSKNHFISYFQLTDVSADAIGMYDYPNARFVPPDAFIAALMQMLVDNKLLVSEFDARGLFYH